MRREHWGSRKSSQLKSNEWAGAVDGKQREQRFYLTCHFLSLSIFMLPQKNISPPLLWYSPTVNAATFFVC